MGLLITDPPYPNGADSDNTLLYKIARDVSRSAGAANGTQTQVVGIQESWTWGASITTAETVIAAGALFFTILLSDDFEGTLNGRTWALTDARIVPCVPSPGNVCPAFTITRSAGSYSILKSLP